MVIVGYDRYFSFSKMIKACSYAKNPDNVFIGTNMDYRLPIRNPDVHIPGMCVVILNAIELCIPPLKSPL